MHCVVLYMHGQMPLSNAPQVQLTKDHVLALWKQKPADLSQRKFGALLTQQESTPQSQYAAPKVIYTNVKKLAESDHTALESWSADRLYVCSAVPDLCQEHVAKTSPETQCVPHQGETAEAPTHRGRTA